ncbi:MAG: efflux transporter periplasmic adaptor subunit [Gammaproteobacteria bacterium]|nr:MAG: efflux transporter periplasmic adaptor subunit [Gammaproteobacteria bacterium]
MKTKLKTLTEKAKGELLAMRRYPEAGGFVVSLVVFVAVLMMPSPRSEASAEILADLDCVVEPSEVVNVGSAVPGLLADAFFERGDAVAAGDILGRLESNVERATLDIAREAANGLATLELRKANAEFGERTLVRNDELMRQRVISRQTRDQVATEAKIAGFQVRQEVESQRLARLEVRRAEASLERRMVRSPITGRVVQRFKSAGEYVDGDAIYEVARLDPLAVDVIVPVEYLGFVREGAEAAVRLDLPARIGEQISAKVDRVDPVADAASGTFGVRLLMPNPSGEIPAGVRCQVNVELN